MTIKNNFPLLSSDHLKEYDNSGGTRCPKCNTGVYTLKAVSSPYGEERGWQDMSCTNCEEFWTDKL